jgi:hypothetical protein
MTPHKTFSDTTLLKWIIEVPFYIQVEMDSRFPPAGMERDRATDFSVLFACIRVVCVYKFSELLHCLFLGALAQER